MNGLINYNIVRPELANAFAAGYEGAELARQERRASNQLARQREQSLELGEMDLEQARADRQLMLQFQDQLRAAGKDTNLDTYFDMMVSSGRPDLVEKGLLGKEKLRQQRVLEQREAASLAREREAQNLIRGIVTGQGGNALASPPTGAAPRSNALTAPPGASIMTSEATAAAMPTAPVPAPAVSAPAAAPAPSAPSSQVDALRTQIGQLRDAAALGVPGAAAAADQLQKRLELIEPSAEKAPPAAIQEYEYAVNQGYTGDFATFRRQKAPLFEPEYAKVVGKTAAERDNQQFTTAGEAASNLPKIYDTLDQLETSDAITGFGADILKNVERFRAQFMADEKAGKRVADTEILDALLGSDVFPMIGALGIGARGLDTPAEREFLRQVMTGTISMDKDALIRLTEIRKNVAERAIDRYNQRVEKGEFDRFFDVQGIEPQKIEKPVRPSVETRNQAAASDTPPPNLDPEIARLWQFMTPEDRMLWLK